MVDYTPKNPKNPNDRVNVTKRRASDNLPAIHRSKINKEFLSATLDHLIQPQLSNEVEGYIGTKPSYYNKNSDFYINEPNNLREFYQLTTALVQKNAETNVIDRTMFYDDLINHLRFQGANVDNHERLFNQEYYSWQPPIDIDKFINFRNYFWVPTGSKPIMLGKIVATFTGDGATDIFTAPNNKNVNPSLANITVNGVSVFEYDQSITQDSWYKVNQSNIQLFPIPKQNDIVKIELISPNKSDIVRLIGNKSATVEVYPGITKTLSSGMRIHISNDMVSSYNDKIYIVEGVGRGIWFVEDTIYSSGWDVTSWDTTAWDQYINVSTPDYTIMERGSIDNNPWSRYNRWFHRDVINEFFDDNVVKIRAERPIIEFQRNLELYDYGFYNRGEINLIIDNIPNFINIINDITETGYDYKANGFIFAPSKHEPSREVWRNNTYDIEIWDNFDSTRDWPVKELGFSEVYVNGTQLFDGLKFLLLNDPTLGTSDRIYSIQGIKNGGKIVSALDSDGIDPSGLPSFGETILNVSNNTSYWFSGNSWEKTQEKLTENQAPLFDLYDIDKNHIGFHGLYPKNNFNGNKIFSYKENTNTGALIDQVLKLRLSYDEFGEIEFENNLVTDRYSYIDADNNIINIDGFYFHKTINEDLNAEYSNDWHKVPYVSPQKYTQRFDVINQNNVFRLNMVLRDLPFSGDYIKVKVDNVELNLDQYNIQQNILRVLPELVLSAEYVEVEIIGDLVGVNKTAYFVEEFVYTDSNIFTLQEVPITPLTDETIKVEVNSSRVDLSNLSQDSLQPNQIRINQTLTSGDLITIGVYIPQAKEPSYSFWNIPLNLEVNPNNEEITTISRGNYFTHFITNIQRQENFSGNPQANNNYRDSGKIKFLGDSILQHTSPLLKTMYMVSNPKVDFIKSVQYVEREYTRFKNKFAQQLKLIQDRNELDFTDAPNEWVALALSNLNLGKTAEFPFYNSGVLGELTWIPPSPAFLGVMPLYTPEIYFQNINGISTKYIKGHDGSLTLSFGDIRDDVLLELETQIYNSVPNKLKGDVLRTFDFNLYKPGKFRNTEYLYDEYVKIISPILERWAANNGVNYRQNSTYDEFNRFSYNYSTTVDLEGNKLPGSWRAIYLWYFDTDKINTHPWESLGFSEKPTWWEDTYGKAPYTRGNVQLWNDIGNGIIRGGILAGEYDHLKRSSDNINIWDILPVSETGELLDPIKAGIVKTIPTMTQASANWEAGEYGPVESVWYQSEQYPFAQVQAAYLMKPALFIEQTWDTFNTVSIDNQIIDLNSRKRSTLTDITVHNEPNVPIKYGVQQYPVNYLKQNSLEPTPHLGDPLRNTYVQLGHKMAGFIDKNNLRVMTDSFGILPNEDIDVKLYESPSIKEEFYSGVIVEWTGKSYRVYGYDVLNPVFKTIPSSQAGKKVKITIGSKQPAYEEWQPQTVYTLGDLVIRENVFYRTKESHRSGNTFEPTYWALVEKPGTTALMELVKYTDPVRNKPVIEVPYGQEFATVQDVFNFFINYERYLISRGWLFDDFDHDIQTAKDWTYSGKQFATWSLNQWQPGTFITLSPISKKVRFKSEQGTIKPLEQIVNGVYSLLNRNGDRIDTNKTIVSRFEDTVEIVPEDTTDNLLGIYSARIYVTETEHAILFNNRTIFNDLIYDPLFGLKQPRLRISSIRSLNWNGRLDAPGFLVNNDTLIPNYEKTATDFRKYFDIEDQVDNPELKNYANHVIAYQKRDYLNDLIISDKSQLNFYQGMIQQKGTVGSLNKLLRSEFVTQDSELELLEEWAFKTGTYGAYDAQPSLELRIPSNDYDRDPQLIEFKEVSFNDVLYGDLSDWIINYEARTNNIVPENVEDWTNNIWDDWFNTFFKDDPNDKTITAYVVKDENGRILAGDDRWERRPDTTSRTFDEFIFPLHPYGENKNVLPDAGYVHVNEYDFVYKTFSDMSEKGIYNQNDDLITSEKRYEAGNTIWLYNNIGLDERRFILDENGNNVVDSFGNDAYTGTTSFRTGWSLYRLITQKWQITSVKAVQASGFVEIETNIPHGVKAGEVIFIYDLTSKTLTSNPPPIVVSNIVSQYRFRVPAEYLTFAIQSVSDIELEILKMVEIRFDTFKKETATSYNVENYINQPDFDPELAVLRKDQLLVNNGINLQNGANTNGWVTYEFDWFDHENEDENIIYAKVPLGFNTPGWFVQDGYNASDMQNSRFVLGKAEVTPYVNGQYKLNDSQVSNDNASLYQLSYNASTLSIWAGSEWKDFDDNVELVQQLPLYGDYYQFSDVKSGQFENFEGRFNPGVVAIAAGFSNMDKHFRTAPKQGVAPLVGDYWIFIDNDGDGSDDEIYERENDTWEISNYGIGDYFWDSNNNVMLQVTSTSPSLAFVTVSLENDSAWFSLDTNIPFVIKNDKPVQVVADDYYWYDTSTINPSGVWKRLDGSTWVSETLPNIGSYVYNILANELYKRVSSPALWEETTTALAENNVVFLKNTTEKLIYKHTILEPNQTLDSNEFIFDGDSMYLWDGTSISIISIADGEKWIAVNTPVIIDSTSSLGYRVITLNSNIYWFNQPLGLLFLYSIATNKFTKLVLSNLELWINTLNSQAYRYDAISNIFNTESLNENGYYYDFDNNSMYLVQNAILVKQDFDKIESNTWYDGSTLYNSNNLISLEEVVLDIGDYFFSNKSQKLFMFDGVNFIEINQGDIPEGYIWSTKDNNVYSWSNLELTVADNGLYFDDLNKTLIYWDGVINDIIPEFLTFKVYKFTNVLIGNSSVIGQQNIFDILSEDQIVFPVAEQFNNLEVNWKRLGPIIKERRRELQKVDSKAIVNSKVYDKSKNILDAYLFAFDPLKGVIPGIVDKELWFKLNKDPAVYGLNSNTGNGDIDPKSAWGRAHVGKLWWDLSTVRYLDYEMDDLEYRRNNWGKLAPLSSIDIYEWTQSLVPPDVYDQTSQTNRTQNNNNDRPSGTPYKFAESYVYNTKEEFDKSSNKIKTYYYFWVKNKTTLPSFNKKKFNRNLTSAQIAQIIENPSNNGIMWSNPIDKNALVFANTTSVITDYDSVLQVNWKNNNNDGNIHSQFELGRANDENWLPSNIMWDKLTDSLLGYVTYWKTTFVKSINSNVIELDEAIGIGSQGLVKINNVEYGYVYNNGNSIEIIDGTDNIKVNDSIQYQAILNVPDPLLTETQKYGSMIRPRQSWFKDLSTARQTFIENFNNQLENVWLDRDRFDWDKNMFAVDPEPNADEYDKKVPDMLALDLFARSMKLTKGYKILVEPNIQTDYYWTMWEFLEYYEGGPIWALYKVQMYRVSDFWEKADYYAQSIDKNSPPLRIFKNIDDFTSAQNVIDFSDGELIQILNVEDPTNESAWEWRQYSENDNTWLTVARENGTIRLTNGFFGNPHRIVSEDHFYNLTHINNRRNFTPFWDLTPWDIGPWDDQARIFKEEEEYKFTDLEVFVQYMRARDGSVELGIILDEIRNNHNFVKSIEQNRIFFSMINYVHTEQPVVDWAFKTSYIVITGYTEKLSQTEILYPDIIEPLFDYITEVKPYHVKIRDFARRISTNDEAKICVTDFDKPVYFDPNIKEYRVLDLYNQEDIDILCGSLDCYENPFQYFATETGICDDVISHTPLVRNIKIEQRFDRVACDGTSQNIKTGWDLQAWDAYPWDDIFTESALSDEPYLFRIIADGRTIRWNIAESDVSTFYNVKTKIQNKTENLVYYPVVGYKANAKWFENIDRVVIKDILAGTEYVVPAAQWSIVNEATTTGVFDLTLVLNITPEENQIVEIVRTLNEYERINRMYKTISTTKINKPISDLIPFEPTIKNCDFIGTVVDGGDLALGWDEVAWDYGSGIIQLPPRPPHSPLNRFLGEASFSNHDTEIYWLDESQVPINQLKHFVDGSWMVVDPLIIGDSILQIERDTIMIWNGAGWYYSQSFNNDGWDQISDEKFDSKINDGAPKEWEFLSGDSVTKEFVLLQDNEIYGPIALVIVYIDNEMVVMNGSDTYDFIWDSDTKTITFNTAPPLNTSIKVFKVYDYNVTGGIDSTFLSPLVNPANKPWETLIEGGDFNQAWAGPNRPEELIYTKAKEAVVLDVYNRPAPGAPMFIKSKFKGDGTDGPFSLYQIAQSKESVYVFENGRLMDVSEYVINWSEQTITFTTPTSIGLQYVISSHSSGGDAVWDTIYIVPDGINGRFSLGKLPILNGTVITINGVETFDYTIIGPHLTSEEIDNGVQYAEDEFEVIFDTVPNVSDTVTISVYVNLVDSILFDPQQITIIDTEQYIAGIDNVSSPLNREFTDLGYYSNKTLNATEFTLRKISGPDSPDWDKTFVYVNGKHLCGPDTDYHTADGVNNCFDITYVGNHIDQNDYVVFVDDYIIPKDEWFIKTSFIGLENASLSAGYDNVFPQTTGWDYLTLPNYTWNGKISLEIYTNDSSVSGNIAINDHDSDGVISQQDFITSVNQALMFDSAWSSTGPGVLFSIQDGRIVVETFNNKQVRISEVNNVPLVSAFFGGANPSIISTNGIVSAYDTTGIDPRIYFNIDHEIVILDLSDYDNVDKNSLVDIINVTVEFTSRNIVASMVGDEIKIEKTTPGYLTVFDDPYEVFDNKVATYFFGNWKAAHGSAITTTPENKICFGKLVISNVNNSVANSIYMHNFHDSYQGYDWYVDEYAPINNAEIVIGSFSNHEFELDGNTLYILKELNPGDEITVITINSNKDMKIRTESFIGNGTGQYELSQNPVGGDYTWVTINDTRLTNNVHYTLDNVDAGWDESPWDNYQGEEDLTDDNHTNNPYALNFNYGISNEDGFDTISHNSIINIVTPQKSSDKVCITTFAGEPRTNAVAMRLFKTDDNQWEHLRIADGHKTILKSDLNINSTYIDVWENDQIPEIMMQETPLMTPNKTYNMPGTVWIGGERINYWQIQGPSYENGRRWWKLDQINRGTFATNTGVEDRKYVASYYADGTTTTFAIPETLSGTRSRIIVELVNLTSNWKIDSEIRLIARDQITEHEIVNNSYIYNSGFWNWDYEIIGDDVVFKNAPIVNTNVDDSIIRITVIEHDYNNSNLTHNQGSTIIDGNINQRIPGGYYWKWTNANPNKGLQRNNDIMSQFLLARPGTI